MSSRRLSSSISTTAQVETMPAARIDGFIKAYAVFRLAYCLMAANAMNGIR